MPDEIQVQGNTTSAGLFWLFFHSISGPEWQADKGNCFQKKKNMLYHFLLRSTSSYGVCYDLETLPPSSHPYQISHHHDTLTRIYFLHCCPFVGVIHWSLGDSLHNGPVIQKLYSIFGFSLIKLLSNKSICCWFKMSQHLCNISAM